MTINQYKSFFVKQLLPFYDQQEAESFFYLALQHELKMTRVDLALQPDLPISSWQQAFFETILGGLVQEKPIQYLLGSTFFYGREFTVSPDVLIPRPETEELVDWILESVRQRNIPNPVLMDIGTGSGCIAISLAAELPDAKLSAIDVSESAISVARNNAARLGVDVDFVHADVLRMDYLVGTFDIIVSNPPYVRQQEKMEMKKNVVAYEPHQALFVSDEDPLIFYRKIAELVAKNLGEGGLLFFEINQYLGEEIKSLLNSLGFSNVLLRKDIYGNDRMICASRLLTTHSEVPQ